jgi:hypothetical protein
MEQIRLECGVAQRFSLKALDILEAVGTHGWLQDLFMYMKEKKMCMHDDQPLLDSFRINDKSIMELFVLYGLKKNGSKNTE